MLLSKYFSSMQRANEGQDTAVADTMTNGNNTDELLEDDYGFSDILDPKLTLELETLKMEQLKVKEEQLQCKSRMLMLQRVEKRPLGHSAASNRCILPDGKIIVRNIGDRGDLDVNHSAGAGDSRVPALLQVSSRACVACGRRADSFCARCGVTPYCSQSCQAKDWADRHRSVCHNLAKLTDVTDGAFVEREPEPSVQNPAPLRRPHAMTDQKRERPPKKDDDNEARDSGRTQKNDYNRRPQQPRAPYNNDRKRDTSPSNQDRRGDAARGRNNQNDPGPAVKTTVSAKIQASVPSVAPKSPQVNGVKTETPPVKPPASVNVVKTETPPVKPPASVNVVKTETPPVKPPASVNVVKTETPTVKPPASVNDVTPTKKVVPKTYVIEQLSIGDKVLLSVDRKASDCRTSVGDYVCLSLHENYQSEYESLVELYTVACEADTVQHKPNPGETFSYFNEEDGGWYRARCLNPTTIALIDASKVIAVTAADKMRRLSPTYEALPEFCCVLECKSEIALETGLMATIISKTGDRFKVSVENVESGTLLGEAFLSRWTPLVDYPPAKPVIPEVPRPDLTSNSAVLLVDVTSLNRAFVRPADARSQTEFDDVVQNVLLAGMNAVCLKEPPVKGQTIIAKFSDGHYYRALCKRTSVAQNKYMIEYVDFGNEEVCFGFTNMYPCPPNLQLSEAPTVVSMVKLGADGGELTPPAAEYANELKNGVELILTLPNGAKTAPSGSEVNLKVNKNSENVNKKITEMCTPDWKKLQDKGGDVLDIKPLMYKAVEYKPLPTGTVELDILDMSHLSAGLLTACVKGDPWMEEVYTSLTQKLADYCNSELGREPYLPMLEELCIAQCPPYPQWFRAVLMDQKDGPGGTTARVCYIDYGNIGDVPVTLIRKMLPEFVHGVPAVGLHVEVEDFPKNATAEILARAAQYLKINDEGRGVLSIKEFYKQEDGLYTVKAPEFIRAVTPQ